MDVPNDTILIRNSTDYTIGSTPYEFLPITNDSLIVISRTDINYVKNDSVIGFTDFGNNGMIDDFVVSALSPTTGRLVMANWINVAILDGGNITLYNDTNGYNTPYTDPIDFLDLTSYGLNSKGVFYMFHKFGEVYKINEPSLIPIKNSIVKSDLKVFPIPFSDRITIQAKDLNYYVFSEIEIFNLQGRPINPKDYTVINRKNSIELDFKESMKNGTYIVTLTSNSGVKQIKIIKQRN
ncbi:T9SS type A sorting domain-containing protein [Hyphobacterium sp. CCMP332]|nr:T9SS type A sorting domain-containing protein [Hyphobacterium sp. CCMP332]